MNSTIFLAAMVVAAVGQTPEDAPAPVASPLDAVEVAVVGPARVPRDSPIEYRIVVQNRGRTDLDGVVVEAVLPEQFRAADSNPTAQQREDRLVWRLARAPAGETIELRFTAVAQTAGPGRVRAFARLDDEAETTFLPPKLPDAQPRSPGLTITINAPDRVRVGEPFSCEAVLANESAEPVDNCGFSLNLTKGLKLREAPGGAAGPLRLDAGGSLRIPLALVATNAGPQGVRARIEADGGLEADAERQIRAEQPDFGVQIDAPSDHLVGAPLRMRFYIANNRPQAADGVQLLVEVPENIEIVSGEAGALFNRRTRTIRWRIGEIPPNEERGFRLTVRPARAGQVEFVAAAQTSSGLSARSAKQIRLVGYAALGVAVEPSADVVAADDLLSVVFDVRSRGTRPAGGVLLRLDASPAFELEAERSNGWRRDGGHWAFRAPRELPPGDTLRATLTLRAVQPGDHLLRAVVVSDQVVGEIVRTQPVHVLPAPPPLPTEPAPPRAEGTPGPRGGLAGAPARR
jgi:uncharacterized repeat protein (TIGR01451 family)